MKVQMLGVLAVVASVTAFAGGEYYVDPRGDNGWTGTADWEHRDTSVTPAIGPRKWLSEAMKLTKDNNGDVVYAAPGHYDEGSKDGYRVVLTQGTKLIATGKKEETFIKGDFDPDYPDLSASPFGCGPNALRCVNIPNKAQVIGFTICNGYAPAYNTSTYCGGAMMSEAKYDAMIVDCIVSNCVAARAGGTRFGIAIRSYFVNNRSGTTGPHAMGTSCYNCMFGPYLGSYAVYSCTLRNCRSGGATLVSTTAYNCDLRSDVSTGCSLYNCYYNYAGTGATLVTNNVKVGEAYMVVDSDYRPVSGSNNGINKGDYFYYTNGVSAAVMPYLDKDFAGGQRVYNGKIDVGCGECDPRAAWSASLCAQSGFAVVEASPEVWEASGGVLAVPVGATLKTSWTASVPNAIDYGGSFYATPSEGATLKAYLDDAAEPFAVVTHADGTKLVSYRAPGSHQLRFVVEGVGDVSLMMFKYTWSSKWFADPRGDNEWDGTVPYEQRDEVAKIGPRKWLSEAMKLTTANNGDVVYAAPGHYNGGSKDGHRVVLTEGTKLIATGAKEETFIEGEIDTTVAQDASPFGCGPNALRCVSLPKNAQIIGFTVCNGRPLAYSDDMTHACAGINAVQSKDNAIACDCIVSNCVSARAAGMRMGNAVRCAFSENRAGTGGIHVMATLCYDCNFGRGVGNYTVYQSASYNCTVVGDSADSTYYNCIFGGEARRSDKFYSSAVSGTLASTCTLGEGSFKASAAELARDEYGRPVKGALSIDRGDYVRYTNGVSAAVLACLGKDFAGGQRVYNGKIDIGCGEYDWRGDFGRKLAKKGVEVVAAAEGVTTNLVTGLDVPAGNPLKMKFVLRTSGEVSLKVTADAGASAAVTVDGSAQTIDADGWCRFPGEEGEYDVEVAVTGSGKATVSDVTLPKFGAVLILR